MKRCASYECSDAANGADKARLCCAADCAAQKWSRGNKEPSASSLKTALENWHKRAEAVFREAISLELAVAVKKAERPKGSAPAFKPTANASACRPPISIRGRRLERLHRAAAHQSQLQGLFKELTPQQKKHWSAAVKDGILTKGALMPLVQRDAIERANQGLAEEAKRASSATATDWRRRFNFWNIDAMKAAGVALRPPAQPAAFTAEDMRKEWQPHWAPEESKQGLAEAWLEKAQEANLARHAPRTWQPPNFEDFLQTVRSAKGAAGLDGWEAKELKALASHAPWLLREIYDILVEVTRCAGAEKGLHESLQHALYAWRIVGIPKRGSDDSRPIAVGAVLMRAWHKALLPDLPEVPAGQWCGKTGVGVIQATADWIAADGESGAELDLAKAFDSVDPEVAATALAFFGTPAEVVGLLFAGWTATRLCHVSGDLSEPLRPTKGLPPGDPTCPSTLSQVLAPWPKLVQGAAPTVKAWAYMDDRSLKAKDSS